MPETLSNSEDLNARILAAANAAAMHSAEAKEREKPEFAALKFTFAPTRGDMGGAFCLVFNGETGEIVLQSLWLTRPYMQKSFKPDRDWRTFIKLFSQLGPYERLWGDKLSLLLPDLVSDKDRTELFEEGDTVVRRYQLHIEGQVRRGFERATQCFFDVDSELELLTRGELERARIIKPASGEAVEEEAASGESGEEGEEGTRKSFEGTVIQCLPCVDPVWGKPSSEVVPGDILEVKIEGDAGPASLVRSFLEETNQTPTFPVKQIDHQDNKTYIHLHISEEIEGIMTLTKDLRLKAKQSYAVKKHHKTALEDLFFFAVLGIVLIGLLLALRFFFF